MYCYKTETSHIPNGLCHEISESVPGAVHDFSLYSKRKEIHKKFLEKTQKNLIDVDDTSEAYLKVTKGLSPDAMKRFTDEGRIIINCIFASKDVPEFKHPVRAKIFLGDFFKSVKDELKGKDGYNIHISFLNKADGKTRINLNEEDQDSHAEFLYAKVEPHQKYDSTSSLLQMDLDLELIPKTTKMIYVLKASLTGEEYTKIDTFKKEKLDINPKFYNNQIQHIPNYQNPLENKANHDNIIITDENFMNLVFEQETATAYSILIWSATKAVKVNSAKKIEVVNAKLDLVLTGRYFAKPPSK